MKVSIDWLKELVELNLAVKDLEELLPLRTIGIKEATEKSIELDMKGYNRADLLSMRGVAMEVSAITDSKINFADEDNFIWESGNLTEAKVKVDNPELAPLYCIAKIEGLKVSKSPDSWVDKLNTCGVRSINNIADITNLVMLEYGQPMHAFDLSEISKETLLVRTAKQGEEIITLDGKIRKLETSDLLITDPEKAVGLAGVMGGKNSEVTERTGTILLEAAIFDPVALRKTAQRLNLQSEASKRFQHGLTRKNLLQALSVAIKMYQDLGGKLTEISIIGDTKDKVKKITLRKEKVNSLLGFEISEKDIEKYLTKLNFKLASQVFDPEAQTRRAEGWEVAVPYFRLDIEIEADLIEEIARMYGYERIKPEELKGETPLKIDQSLFNNIYDLKVALANYGLTEVQTYSFYSTDVIENCKLKIENLIKISNPISAETEYLRTHLWPNLVETIAKNKKQGFDNIAIFEVGKTYQLTKTEGIQEECRLSIALLNGTNNPAQNLYQILQKALSSKDQIILGDPIGKSDGKFHPNRYFYLMKNEKLVGKIGEVHLRITDKFGINQRVAVLEIRI